MSDDKKNDGPSVKLVGVGIVHGPDCPVYGNKAPASTGPANVNSDEFRSGWDRIFGGKQPIGEA